MECILCGGDREKKVFTAKILNKYMVSYYQCPDCGLLHTQKPYWLNEAYSEAISCLDTGVMQRNLQNVEKLKFFLDRYYEKDASFLDYGGGYGVFTRMMRDQGKKFFWYDKFADSLLAKGFEYSDQNISCITAFEMFEHMDTPFDDIKKMLTISPNLVFTTYSYDKEMHVPEIDWWYYAFESGQHITFFSRKTYDWIARKFNVNYYEFLGYGWFTNKKISKFSLVINRVRYRFSKKCFGGHIDFHYAEKDNIFIKNRLHAKMNEKDSSNERN